MRFLVIIKNTPKRIKKTPVHIFTVSCSWKNITPKNIAVNGSNAPRIAVVVDPTSFIDIERVSREIIVGNNAKASVHIQRKGLCIICSCVQNFKLYT